MKILKSFGIGVFGLSIFVAILYVLLLLIIPNAVDLNNYKGQISTQIEKNTGLKFSAENMDLKFSYSPYLNLYAHHVKFIYPNGDTFIKITDANIKIKVLPILFKKIEINKIILTRPILNFTLYDDCSTSIEKYIKPIKSGSPLFNGFTLVNKIPDIQFDKYKLKVRDVNLYSPFIFEGDRFLLSDFELDKNVHIKTKGVLYSDKTPYINYDLNIESYLKEFKDKKFFKVSPFKNIKKYRVKGNIYAHLKVKKKDKFPQIEGVLNFNKLSFRIQNRILENNSVKLLFDNQNIDIFADVCTSLKDKATITGKVSYGNKQYIDLKVKALNANISNLEELTIATLDSLNVKNQFRDYRASGIANLDFQIKSNFKKIQSQGIAEILDATIVSKSSPFKITNINANISFSDNEIKIKKAIALVNSTPLTISGNISDTADADILISGDSLPLAHLAKMFVLDAKFEKYIIENGIFSFTTKITGKLNKLNIKLDAKVADIIAKDKKNDFVFKSPMVKIKLLSEKDIFEGTISLLNSDFTSKKLQGVITSKNIALNFDPKQIILNKGTFFFNGSPISSDGIVKNYLDVPDFDFNLNGKLSANQLYKCFLNYSNLKASAKGSLPIIGKITGTPNNINADVQVLANNSNYVSFLVIKELLNRPSILNLSMNIKGNSVIISDFALYKLISSNGKLSNDFALNINKAKKILSVGGKVLNFNNLNFENIKISVPDSLTFSVSGLKGSEVSIKTDVLINGKLLSPIIKGNLIVNHLYVPDYSVKSNNINLTFDNSNVYLRAPELVIKNSKFDVTANVSPRFSKTILVKDIKLLSTNFDLPSVASSFAELANSQISQGFIVPVKIISGKSYINNFTATGLQATNVSSEFSLDNNLLKIRKMTADAYNGRVWGNIDYNFLYASTALNLFGRSLDASPAILALTQVNDNVTGKLDFSTKATLFGYSRSQQLKSLKGSSKITIHNGQLGTLGKFEHFLYAQNLISQTLMKSTINLIAQAVTAKNTGRFKYLNANMTFSDGYATLDPLEFSGPNMSMLMTGRLNMLNNWADFEILGKVSHEVTNVLGPLGELSLSNIVSNIPRLNNVTLPNLFFNSYNLGVSPSVIAKIPSLTPKTDLKSKNFIVRILGNVDSVKSVKSFKWLVLKSEVPQTQQNYYESRPVDTSSVNTIVVPVRKKQAELPGFLDNLPDSIK